MGTIFQWYKDKTMNKVLFAAAFAFMPFFANAATVTPVFTDQGLDTTNAQGTRMYRADLSGLGLTEIGSVKITDSNSGIGGSTGIYSGFDLDAIFLDIDGLLSTASDRYFATTFLYAAGSVRPGPFASPSPSGGPLNGSSSSTQVDTVWSTLDAVDAIWFGAGSLTLGDGGILTAGFGSPIDILSSLYLFVGEVSGDPGENVSGLIEISDEVPDPAPIPLPASALLLLGALGVLGLRRRLTS